MPWNVVCPGLAAFITSQRWGPAALSRSESTALYASFEETHIPKGWEPPSTITRRTPSGFSRLMGGERCPKAFSFVLSLP